MHNKSIKEKGLKMCLTSLRESKGWWQVSESSGDIKWGVYPDTAHVSMIQGMKHGMIKGMIQGMALDMCP